MREGYRDGRFAPWRYVARGRDGGRARPAFVPRCYDDGGAFARLDIGEADTAPGEWMHVSVAGHAADGGGDLADVARILAAP